MKKLIAIAAVFLATACSNSGSNLSEAEMEELTMEGVMQGQYEMLCSLMERGLLPEYELESEVILARERLGDPIDKNYDKDIRTIIAEDFPVCSALVYIDWN